MSNHALVHESPRGIGPGRSDGQVRELLEAFLSGKKETTLRAYKQDLQKFADFLDAESPQVATEMLLSGGAGNANKLALQFKNHMLEEDLKPATVNRRLSSLRALVKLGRILGMVNFHIEIQNERVTRYKDTSGPGIYSMRQLVDALDRSEKGRRDCAILRLLFDLALRRGEIVKLNYPEDINFERGLILVESKGSREKHMLSLPDSTKSAIEEWVGVRGEYPGPLFTNLDPAGKGKRLTGRSIDRNVLKPLGKKLGISVSPHGIRHTAITEAVKAAQSHGIGLEEVLDFSRHKSVKTLMVYRDRERNVQGKLAELVSKGV